MLFPKNKENKNMKNILFRFILYIILYLSCSPVFSHAMENNLNIEYKVVEASELKSYFFKDNTNIILSSNDLYVIGYVSQTMPFKYDIYCKLYFFNPGRRGLKRIADVGWVSDGKFFILKLGSKNIYSKELVYEIKIEMRK